MTSSFRHYVHLYSGFRLRLVAFLGMALLQILVAAPLPFIVMEIFDVAIADERLDLLIGLCVLMIGLQLLSIVIGLISANWLLGISTRAVQTLRQRAFDQLYALSIRFHETHSLGDLHDRMVHETERIDAMTRSGYAVAVPAAIFTVGIAVVLFLINWVLALITVAFVPVVYVVNRITRDALRRASRKLHASIEAFSGTTWRSLRTMRQTRILGAEPQARDEQDDVLTWAAEAAHHQGLMNRFHFAANRMVMAVWAATVLVTGGGAVIAGWLTLGELFAFYAGLALIRQPINALILSVPVIVAGREALDRVFELLDVDDPRPYTGKRQLDIEGRLSVQHVTFEYEEDHPVLVDASLEVEPGEVVALMGPNGSGKTTVASLMMGFYRPAVGRIDMDGVDYDELDMQYLRRQFGVVTQDPMMIPGTVRENITYGRPDVTEGEILRAVEQATARHLIEALEDGLDTVAYENGPLLSGGQMQRIALARALLGRPRLLILDEPTNHLDVAGLEGLLLGLRSLDDAPAMVLITHKQEVAVMADSLHYMENGRVIRSVESPPDHLSVRRNTPTVS